MNIRRFSIISSLAMVLLMCFAFDSSTLAQGRGGGRPPGAGGGAPAGSPGVDRGLGNASIRSDGRSDTGLSNASTRSNGRSASGLDRARMARDNANAVSDTELNRFRGLSRRFGSTPADMRAAFQAALTANPDLTFGQFVAANVIADNLGGRFPSITSSAILAGLADGHSIGSTLQTLGLSKDQAKVAKTTADDEIKSAKNRKQ